MANRWATFTRAMKQSLSKFVKNLTYAVIQGVVNVELTRFTYELRTLVDTGVRLMPARPKIKDDNDVEMLCDDRHVPEVYVSGVEQFSAEPSHMGVHTVQPVHQSFLQQLVAQFEICIVLVEFCKQY